jgi:hypothetical protein
MTMFAFKGGPLDGTRHKVECGVLGRYPAVFSAPDPRDTDDLSWSWGSGESPPVPARQIMYHLTKVSDGHGGFRREYWTQEARAADLHEQRPVADRVRALEATVHDLSTKLDELTRRLNRVLETNELWDGS